MKRTLLTLTLTLLLSNSILASTPDSGDSHPVQNLLAQSVSAGSDNYQPVPNGTLFAVVISLLF